MFLEEPNLSLTEPSPVNIMSKTLIFGPHMTAPYGAPFCFFKKRTTITEKLPLSPTSQVFWGGKFSKVAIIYLMIFHRLLFLLPSSTLENLVFPWCLSQGLRNVGKKKKRKRITIMTKKQEKPLYTVIKRLLPPCSKHDHIILATSTAKQILPQELYNHS